MDKNRHEREQGLTPTAFSSSDLDRISSWARQADQKSAFGLTLVLALMGAVFSRIGIATQVVNRLVTMVPNGCLITVALALVLLIQISSSTIAIVYLLRSVSPRVNPKVTNSVPIFFGHISEMSLEEFRESARNLDESELKNHLIDQAYEVSRVTAEKYRLLSIGYRWFWFVLVSSILFILATSMLWSYPALVDS